MEQEFHSCKRLGVKRLDTLLLHAPVDLRKTGSEHLESWMMELREQGLVKRIGFQLYRKRSPRYKYRTTKRSSITTLTL